MCYGIEDDKLWVGFCSICRIFMGFFAAFLVAGSQAVVAIEMQENFEQG